MLAKRKVRSARPITAMQAWWLTHQIPIVTNETTYAAYWGQECTSAAPSAPPGASAETSMIRSVAAIAKTAGEELQPGGLHDSRRD